MESKNIDFGTGANTSTGDSFPSALAKINLRVSLLGGTSIVGPATAARIAGTPSNGNTLTATPGTWPGNPNVSGKWTRDGAAISGATGLTYVYNAATDDGSYVRYEETVGSVTAPSNALIATTTSASYATSFNAPDGTDLDGFEGWVKVGGSAAAGTYTIVDGQITQNSAVNSSVWTHATASNDVEIEVTANTSVQNSNRINKTIYARYTDGNNYILFNFDYNNWSLTKKVGGANQQLQAYTNFSFADGGTVKLRVQGNYCRVYYNGVELSQSAAANGGLGFDVSGVPAANMIATNSGQIAGAYPYKHFYDLTIYTLSANGIVATASVSNIDNTPGRQQITVSGTTLGAVRQPQAMVISNAGTVFQNWTNLTWANGAFSGTLPEITQDAEVVPMTIWVRDASLKSVTRTTSLPGGAVPIQWHTVQVDYGLNTQGIMHYAGATEFVDLTKNTYAGVTGTGIFHSSIMQDHVTVRPQTGALTERMPYADMGMTDGWPTKVPAGVSPWPADLKFALKLTPPAGGFTPTQAGVFDVQFTPGLDWFLDGQSANHMVLTDYNLAAGTAVLTLTAGKAGQSSARFVFKSYNGVANTFPTGTARLFKVMKRGEDQTSVFTASTLASWKGLTSAAKIDANGYHGALRFMSNNAINRSLGNGYLENFTRKEISVNRLGNMDKGSFFHISEMLDACKRIRCHLYLNIPDTADPSMVLYEANHLNDNMPTGMAVYVEYSNEIAFNFLSFFAQSYALTDRATAAGVGRRTQLSRDIKSVVAVPFASVFGRDNPRWNLTVGEQAAKYANVTEASMDAAVAELLDEGDLYLYARGMCVACYVGNAYSYVDGGSEGGFMSLASRDKAGIDDAGFLNDYFAAQFLMSDWTRDNYWYSFANALARYTAKKGLPRGTILPVAYEYSWQHSDMKPNNLVNATGSITGNTLTITSDSNGPIRAGDVLIGTGVIAATKVLAQLTIASGSTAGKAGTYSVDTAHTTPTGVINVRSSNNVYAQAVGVLIGKSLRDPRSGIAQNYQDAWIRKTGGVACHFDHVGYTGSTYNTGSSAWGYEDYVGREQIDEPYKSTAADMIVNGW